MIRLKRVYDEPAKDDGQRVLVERLWPRGLNKQRAAVDLWIKDIAPTSELRKWYSHDITKWGEFQKRYRAELDRNSELIGQLRAMQSAGTVTFVFASRDTQHNSAVVLKAYLETESGE